VVLSQRERNIVIATVTTLSLLAVFEWGVSPYLAKRAEVVASRKALDDDLEKRDRLFSRQDRLRKVWKEIQAGGLKTDSYEAESQAETAVLTWAGAAGLELTGIKADRSVTEGKFQINSFHITVTGPLRSVSRLFYAIETASIPLRINEVQIRPQREGTDELTVQVSLSTLSQLPDSSKSNKTTLSAADFGGGRP
jgi:hypothetical protein